MSDTGAQVASLEPFKFCHGRAAIIDGFKASLRIVAKDADYVLTWLRSQLD